MQQALAELGRLKARAARARVTRPPRVQPRLAHGDRPAEPADRVGGDHAVRDRAEGEPRRPFPRRLSRRRRRSSGRSTSSCGRRPTGRWRSAASRSPRCRRAEAGHRGEQVAGRSSAGLQACFRTQRRLRTAEDNMAQATFRVWRGDATAGEFQDYTAEVVPGHGRARRRPPIQATQAHDLACAGTARPASAARARRRSTASRG